MRLLNRHRLLLALIASSGTLGRTEVHKLLLLYCHEWEKTPSYEFVPYRYGGFSFTASGDVERLKEAGLLAEQDPLRLTSAGQAQLEQQVDAALRQRVERFLQRYGGVRGQQLISLTYRRYPWFAIRSRIADQVTDEQTREKIEQLKQRLAQQDAGVVTIGYEGRSLEAYLNLLLENGVTLLCDVRRNPISRKYGFSKRVLMRACNGVGIRYEHLPQLGIDSASRKGLDVTVSRPELFARYRAQTLPQQQPAIEQIARWVREGERVALTCFEREHHQCHRHCVADALTPLAGEAVHL